MLATTTPTIEGKRITKYYDRLKIPRYEKCRIRLLYWELML